MTLKDLVKQTVEVLTQQGKTEFTAAEICETALRIDPSRKRASVQGTLSGLVVGHKHPVYTREDQFLDKARHGVYKLYEPEPEPTTKSSRKRSRSRR